VSDKNFFNYLALITQLGLVIVISILIGLFVGAFLDRKTGLRGVFTIIFVVFGVIGGFMAAYRLIKDLDKEDNG
jgi:ATP synthase protein I